MQGDVASAIPPFAASSFSSSSSAEICSVGLPSLPFNYLPGVNVCTYIRGLDVKTFQRSHRVRRFATAFRVRGVDTAAGDADGLTSCRGRNT